jgi:pimeloyl-ACP methyl ester carboxylesterase
MGIATTGAGIAAILFSALTVFPLASCGKGHAPAEETRREVTLTADGVDFAGTLYLPRVANPPALLLLHGSAAARDAWAPVAVRAQREGYLCLAVDLGISPADDAESREGLLRRIDEGFRRLPRLGGNPSDLGVVGAGTGADLALEYAVQQPDVQALVLLSPGAVLEGERAVELAVAYGKRPIFYLTTAGDAFSAETARRMRAASPGFAELREYAGSANGTDIFATSDNAAEQLLNWLNVVLPPHGSSSP